MIFQHMGEHPHLICRHAGYKHMAKPSPRQHGKAFLCAIQKGITFTLVSPSDHSKHDAAI